ncbi:MAG: AMP-binding protein [Candidatus Eisenbacteria bacterium]|nr:AMP-binding protein [Candidatus Eisenbacteria bacterium]
MAVGFEKFGITILEGYGLSEASPILTVNRAERPKIGSVGPAIPGVTIRIDGSGENGVGEILASGENIMAGYFGKEEETKKVLVDGWLRTGDLGWIDSDGHLHIVSG